MTSPLDQLRRLRDAVLARTAPTPPSAALARYLEKVEHRATSITDDDVARLLASGHDQDEVFERTVGAALGAAIVRFEAGLRALDEAEESR